MLLFWIQMFTQVFRRKIDAQQRLHGDFSDVFEALYRVGILFISLALKYSNIQYFIWNTCSYGVLHPNLCCLQFLRYSAKECLWAILKKTFIFLWNSGKQLHCSSPETVLQAASDDPMCPVWPQLQGQRPGGRWVGGRCHGGVCCSWRQPITEQLSQWRRDPGISC